MARKTTKSTIKRGSSSEEKNEYSCVGGSPKMRREMKRHKDMMKKFGKNRIEMEDDDD